MNAFKCKTSSRVLIYVYVYIYTRIYTRVQLILIGKLLFAAATVFLGCLVIPTKTYTRAKNGTPASTPVRSRPIYSHHTPRLILYYTLHPAAPDLPLIPVRYSVLTLISGGFSPSREFTESIIFLDENWRTPCPRNKLN